MNENIIDAIDWLNEITTNPDGWRMFYSDSETKSCAEAALALLKERETEVLQVRSWEDEYYGTVAFCPKCECKWIMANDRDLHFCPKCGQAVKWND